MYNPEACLNLKQMFSGVPPSRRAEDLVARATVAGINPIQYTIKAGMASLQGGRKKVGFFGEAEQHLKELNEIVKSREDQKAVYESPKRGCKR